MPKPRLSANKDLPPRWVRKHGAIYYFVPPGHEHLWHHKQWFRLGSTLPEAWKTWTDQVAAIPDPVDTPTPDLESAPRSPTIVKEGVYALFLRNEVVYVGRSDSVLARIAEHIGRFEFDSFTAVPAIGFVQERLEQILIAKHAPKNNIRSLSLII